MTVTTCSYCHLTSVERIPAVEEFPCRSQKEAALFHSEIQRLDDLVAEISEQRAAVLRKLYAIRPLPTILPRELLSLIFQFACAPAATAIDSDPLYHLVLARVSVQWREVVLSTPHLWTSLRLDIGESTQKAAASSLLRFLRLSGGLPLTLSLHFSPDFPTTNDILLDHMVDPLLMEKFPRIETLHLSSPPHRWLSPPPHLPNLTQFTLSKHDCFQREISLVNNPRLHRLSLQGIAVPSIRLPSSCLVTILNLQSVPIDLCIKTLAQCSGLVEFHSIAPRPAHHPDEIPRLDATQMMFQHLKVFEWGTTYDHTGGWSWQSALLSNIQFPLLQVLSWSQGELSVMRLEDEGTRRFFAHLPPTLTTLELAHVKNIRNINGYFIDHLHGDLDIENLRFQYCNLGFVVEVIHGLTPPDANANKKLPQLRKFTMERISLVGTAVPVMREFSGSIVKMLATRMQGPNDALTLTMSRPARMVWTPEIEKGLSGLRCRGCKLKIIEGSVVKWSC